MPFSNGVISIFANIRAHDWYHSWLWCQYPMSGVLHFYVDRNEKKENLRNVSMSYVGLSSFLQLLEDDKMDALELCQCPVSGVLHFYTVEHHAVCEHDNCVNALCRAFFISTEFNTTCNQFCNSVSMPCIGLSSFLHA